MIIIIIIIIVIMSFGVVSEPIWYIVRIDWKSSSITLPLMYLCFIINHDFCVITLWMN